MARTNLNKYLQKELADIVGATITEVGASEPDDLAPDGWPYITVKTGHGKIITVVIMQDAEGNGAGHIRH